MNDEEKIEILKDIKNGKIREAFIRIRNSIDRNNLTNRYNMEREKLEIPPDITEIWLEKIIDTAAEDLLDVVDENEMSEEYIESLKKIIDNNKEKDTIKNNIGSSSLLDELAESIREEVRCKATNIE